MYLKYYNIRGILLHLQPSPTPHNHMTSKHINDVWQTQKLSSNQQISLKVDQPLWGE